MAKEKASLSAVMGAVMGVEKSVPNKLRIDPHVTSWSQLPAHLRQELTQEALKQSRKIKRKTS